MSRAEENYVALFIDWDNLAISTAVDFAGAVPDVKAIVRAAQRSGTVLIARAYAEWNVSSDRLSVYRAGVEPVYAPTFRFEPEPGSQVPRGKSLADPCLVTDCIDTMHLMPDINVFVLVSGDKDLIPIVRIAQLRGKKVVVIGPDFVAAILREMADEYIPYRVLAENSDTTPTEVSVHGTRGQRRVPASARSASLPPAPAPRQAAPARPQAAAPVAKPAAVESNGTPSIEPAPPPVETIPPPAIEPAAEPEVVTPSQDAGPLFETLGAILREREQAGKPRLRTTNLKDQLIARIPGFDERHYGFTRFKDLLAAAEKAGVLSVTRTGPVQWVAAVSPTPAAPAAPPTPAPVVSPPVPAPAEEPPPPAPVVAAPLPTVVPAPPASDDEIDADVVRYILELRERSRWLTYTYVLTNLLNHLGKGGADATADAAARATLNRLVQSGVLIVDREPREIDVNGARHRVRLCHIVDEHPLVANVLAKMAAEIPTAEVAPALPAELERPAGVDLATVGPTELAAAQPTDTVDVGPEAAPAKEAAAAEERSAVSAASEASFEARAPVVTESVAVPLAPEVTEPASVDAGTVAEAEASSPLPEAEEREPGAEASAEPLVPPATVEAGGNGNGHAQAPPALTLVESYAVLRDVVREATGPNRPSTGPAAVKNRLVRKLGAFDEHAFGFSKFKDYLLSAERAGAVKVEMVGTTARVSLPAAEEPAAAS